MSITYDDFKKIDLRVGKIKEVTEHPNADRLYVIKVDMGDREKQVVAGIRNSYKKEDLVGKLVIIVDNLETAMLRGIESQGMLLASSDDTGLSIVTLDGERKLGSVVK